MAQQEDQIYDLYLTAFGKARAEVAFTANDLKDLPSSGDYIPYTGRELAAVVQGIADGKSSAGVPLAKSELRTFLDKQLK